MNKRNAAFASKALVRGRREITFNANLGYRGETLAQQVESANRDTSRDSYRAPSTGQQWKQSSITWSTRNARKSVKATQVKSWEPKLNSEGLRPGAGKVIK